MNHLYDGLVKINRKQKYGVIATKSKETVAEGNPPIPETPDPWDDVVIDEGLITFVDLQSFDVTYKNDLNEARQFLVENPDNQYKMIIGNNTGINSIPQNQFNTGSSTIHEQSIQYGAPGVEVGVYTKFEFESTNGLSNLKSIRFNKDLQDIGQYAFNGCCVEEIEFVDDGVSDSAALFNINKGAFYGCGKLVKVIGNLNKLAHIGESCFVACNALTEFPFETCNALQAIDPWGFHSTSILLAY